MARKQRMEIAGGLYHVVTRGNNRESIYSANWSGRLFVELLGQTSGRFGWNVVAYCLMSNHYHLVLRTSERGLSGGMCELNGLFAKSSNAVTGRSNHLFGRRYWSEHIETDAYLLSSCCYVLLNPVRAGATDDPVRWRWSSLRATLGHVPAPSFLEPELLLEQLGRNAAAARLELVAMLGGALR